MRVYNGRIKFHNIDIDTRLCGNEHAVQCLRILRQLPEEFLHEFFKWAFIMKAAHHLHPLRSFIGHKCLAHKGSILKRSHLEIILLLLQDFTWLCKGPLEICDWLRFWHGTRNTGGCMCRHIWCQVARNLVKVTCSKNDWKRILQIVIEHKMKLQQVSRKHALSPFCDGDDVVSHGTNGRLLPTLGTQFYLRIWLMCRLVCYNGPFIVVKIDFQRSNLPN